MIVDRGTTLVEPLWCRTFTGRTAHALYGRSGSKGRARCGRVASGNWYVAEAGVPHCSKCMMLSTTE